MFYEQYFVYSIWFCIFALVIKWQMTWELLINLLSAYAKKGMHIDQSLHTISKNVGLFLTDKTPLNELFNKTVPKEKSDEELYPSLFGNDDF